MSERGYIYIIQPEFVIENIFKIGKTVNIESTYQTYSRMINIKKKHFYVVNYLSYIEALILNILGPHRILKEDNVKISGQVKLPFGVIDHVVCWVINWVSMYGKETSIKLSRSVNTLTSYRTNIPARVWHNLCDYI